MAAWALVGEVGTGKWMVSDCALEVAAEGVRGREASRMIARFLV